MARILPTNPRYRTKDEIAKDVTKILTSDLHYGTKFAVVKEVTWVWTEFNGKFAGCIYWTDAALRRFERLHWRNYLRHEHVVPKKVVIEMLFGLKRPDVQSVRAILDKFLIGVIVTKEEDSRLNLKYSKTMPPEFANHSSPSFQDPWLRYRACEIRVQVMPHQRAAILEPLSKVALSKTYDQSALDQLQESLYRHGWVNSEFDWSNWQAAEEYVAQPKKIESADIIVIQKLLTTHVRKERFCEGHLESMMTCGHFSHLYRRLTELQNNYIFD